MTVRLTALLVAAGVLAAGDRSSGQQPPVFRTTTDLVSVDVFVRAGATPVPGLTAADFLVLDNGVSQRIESIDAARSPLDVSLLVDVSGGRPEWWGTPRSPARIAEDLESIVQRTSRLLGPGDRVRLMTIDTYTDEALPFQAPGSAIAIDPGIATAGMSSLHDALVAALLRPAVPDRRHVVIAMTKAEDTISTVEMAALQDIARRADAVLHIVLGTSLVGDTKCVQRSDLVPGGDHAWGVGYLLDSCLYPRRRFWRPADRRDESLLPALAEATGGAFYGLDALLLYRDLSDEVERIFDQFRRGYVLRYTPQGVKREGWHEISVSVPSRPQATIQARRGYAVEAVRPDAPRLSPAAAGGRVVPPGGPTIEWLADFFAARQYAAFESGLARAFNPAPLLKELRTSGSVWPDAPRRDAVFALELAVAGLNRGGEDTREEAVRLIEQYATFVREPFGAGVFECTWYWTGMAAVEGVIRPALAQGFVTRALARCPDEPRFHLAAAVVTDQQWPLGTTTRVPGRKTAAGPSPEQRQEVTRRYEAAMAFPETAIEAGVRAAWFAFRVGEYDRALALVDGASGPVADPHLSYLREFIRAQVLRALGQFDAAAGSFRRALTIWPGAQSARLGLMALLVAHGDRDEAEALAETIQTETDTAIDPWWLYWQGDFRAYGGILAKLREMAP